MSLIPVNSLVGFAQISDGYMFNTETNQLLSNKNGSYVPLNGSVRDGIRRYNLQYKKEYQTRWAKSRSVKHVEVSYRAAEAAKRLGSIGTTNKLVEAAKAQAQKQTKGWVIGSILNGSIKLTTSPKVHETEASANAEIERLADTNKGTTFVKLKVENFVVSGGVQWS